MFSKKLCKICSILFIFIIFLGAFSVYADFTPSVPNTTGANEVTNATKVAKNIWKTASVIIQILAVAAIVFAGLRYMFASADAKADIKQQTAILVIGAVLVFGAVNVAKVISNASNYILQ